MAFAIDVDRISKLPLNEVERDFCTKMQQTKVSL